MDISFLVDCVICNVSVVHAQHHAWSSYCRGAISNNLDYIVIKSSCIFKLFYTPILHTALIPEIYWVKNLCYKNNFTRALIASVNSETILKLDFTFSWRVRIFSVS